MFRIKSNKHPISWLNIVAKRQKKRLLTRRDIKNSLFCSLFSDKKRALSLYNAINGTSYDNPDELQVVTLEDVVYLHQKNDVSILFDSRLTLWEHQSTFNPNMPIRGLLYYAQNLENLLGDSRRLLYRESLVNIPEPAYYVLYNGERECPEKLDLRLSDAFSRPTDGYEWTAHLLKKKSGKKPGILGKLPELKGYATLIQYIRDFKRQGYSDDQAVDMAVERCIEEGYLADYLQKLRREAKRMLLTEFDEEGWEWAVREDGKEEGRKEGLEQGIPLGEDKLARLLREVPPNSKDFTTALNGTSEERKNLYKKYKISV